MTPIGNDDARFAEGVYEFPVQALGPEPAVEAFHIAVLPGTSRVDVEGLDFVSGQALLDGLGDELGAVVGADVLGRPIALNGLLEQIQLRCRACWGSPVESP